MEFSTTLRPGPVHAINPNKKREGQGKKRDRRALFGIGTPYVTLSHAYFSRCRILPECRIVQAAIFGNEGTNRKEHSQPNAGCTTTACKMFEHADTPRDCFFCTVPETGQIYCEWQSDSVKTQSPDLEARSSYLHRAVQFELIPVHV